MPASLYLVAEGEGETGWGSGSGGWPLFANYLYSCFVPFRHSQRLVRSCYYKVQAEVTSAGRHIIYVISVLNYLHRKYGRLTSVSTATVGHVRRHPPASSGAELSVSPTVSHFFLMFRFFFFFWLTHLSRISLLLLPL